MSLNIVSVSDLDDESMLLMISIQARYLLSYRRVRRLAIKVRRRLPDNVKKSDRNDLVLLIVLSLIELYVISR